jgi:hypothetical protein
VVGWRGWQRKHLVSHAAEALEQPQEMGVVPHEHPRIERAEIVRQPEQGVLDFDLFEPADTAEYVVDRIAAVPDQDNLEGAVDDAVVNLRVLGVILPEPVCDRSTQDGIAS